MTDLTNLTNINFIYDIVKDICCVSVRGGPETKLENKGITNKGGNWYQLDDNLSHWISFNPDKFDTSKIEAFYKRPEAKGFKYYRQTFKDLEKGDHLIIFTFSQFDEWIKDEVDGKWKSKYNQQDTNENKQPWKNKATIN